VNNLHRRASVWFEEQGLIEEALQRLNEELEATELERIGGIAEGIAKIVINLTVCPIYNI
jgi:ATP/maltotriose-dependent transcriptional regulator MalT